MESKLFIFVLFFVGINALYLIGNQGQNCFDACYDQGMNCNPRIVTNNSGEIFEQLGINCTMDPAPWATEDQPSFCSDPNDPNHNYGKCLGFVDLPGGVQCSGSFYTTRRLCRCDAPSTQKQFFSTAYAGGSVGPTENSFFAHYLASGDVGVTTHFWTTYQTADDDGVVVRYYIDGETNASITFTPSMACGVGFFDSQAPWGTEWFGKGSNNGGWFNNFRIPFQKSIRVTIQHLDSTIGGFYFIMRGATNLPITIGGVTLPSNARMNQLITNGLFQPLEWVVLANATGAGVHWMHTLSVAGADLNFLEGCYHAYVNQNMEFPGILLSSGTEDYFDSAWYFDAGEFHLPVSGFTHFDSSNGIQWSGYRFHDQDPLFFDDGFQLVWRNGDMLDPTGIKCMMEANGTIVGSPSIAQVVAYSWVYTW